MSVDNKSLCIVTKCNNDYYKFLEYNENNNTTIVLVTNNYDLEYVLNKYKNEVTHVYISDVHYTKCGTISGLDFYVNLINNIPENIEVLIGEISDKIAKYLSVVSRPIIICNTYCND